jgi:uncharacterized protein involved in exopolysaccharide biosynthesis
MPDAGPSSAPDPHEVSLLEIANVLLRHRRAVLGWPLASALIAIVVTLLLTPVYTATTAFTPEQRTPSGVATGLASLAGQLGFTVGADANSPRFYADVVRSPRIVEQVLRSRYPDPRAGSVAGDSVSLLVVLQVRAGELADSVQHGAEKLGKLMSVRVDPLTGIVRLSIDHRYPTLASDVANRFVHYLNEFNAVTRQSQARERRRFAETRVAEAERELRTAEEALQVFYERNRSWARSPTLVVAEQRHRRDVALREQVMSTLRGEFEVSRIEEVNDTPVLTVVHEATPPRKRSWPRRALLVSTATLLGILTGVAWAFAADYVMRLRTRYGQDYQEFRRLTQSLRGAGPRDPP